MQRLEEDIKSEVSGHFEDGLLALLEPTDEYEAKCKLKIEHKLA